MKTDKCIANKIFKEYRLIETNKVFLINSVSLRNNVNQHFGRKELNCEEKTCDEND
jgi:hypothetical protein